MSSERRPRVLLADDHLLVAEAPISGTSTNPARSLGPAVVSGQWQGW